MVVGLVTRTTSKVARTASRQVARRKMSNEVVEEPKKYNLPDFDDTSCDPHKFWPFSWNRQLPFTLKYALYTSSGFSFPYLIVYYQMVLKD